MLKRLILSLAMVGALQVPVDAQTATYYANMYQGRRTASGVRFDQGQPMAAHPSYPFGTRLRVTNRRTGKSVVVRVVDRCRCSLDLSTSAFRQIGSLRQGRIPVSIQVLR